MNLWKKTTTDLSLILTGVKKEIYIEAAKKYGIDYHICNNATDINGRPIDLLAFYVHNSYDSLDGFWKILDNLKYSKR